MPGSSPGFLHHGVNAAGELVAIDAVARGRTRLGCPYCSTALIAKKGRVLAPHFAHDGPTCRESRERGAASVPLYDDFESFDSLERADLRLCARLGAGPINHTALRGWRRDALARLLEAGLIEEVPRGQRWVNGVGSHRHSAWGQQVVAAMRRRLTLAQLARVQQHAALHKLARLERSACSGKPDDATDLRLYCAQLARLFSLQLYLLRVQMEGGELHKIGVTARPVEERLPEVRRDLREHLGEVELELAGSWRHRGSLEPYFKRLFARRALRIGPLTEYFSFDAYRKPLAQLAQLDEVLEPRLLELLAAAKQT